MMKQILGYISFILLVLLYISIMIALTPFLIILFLVIPSMRTDIVARLIPYKGFGSANRIVVHVSSAGEAKLAVEMFGNSVLYSYFNNYAIPFFRRKNCYYAPKPFENGLSTLLFYIAHNIKTVVLLEQELWPTMIVIAKILGIKIYVVNGIMYERSFKSQQYFKFFFKPLLNCIQHFYIQSYEDQKRLILLDIDIKKTTVTGNLKLSLPNEFSKLKNTDDIVTYYKNIKINDLIIFGSFHSNELGIMEKVITILDDKSSKIIIAPRQVKDSALCKTRIRNAVLWSEFVNDQNLSENNYLEKLKECFTQYNVIIIDGTGVLPHLYQYANIAVIGGSFNNKGAQNFAEPLFGFCQTIIGDSYYNFESFVPVFYECPLSILDEKYTVENPDTVNEIIRIINDMKNATFDIYAKKILNCVSQLKEITEKKKEIAISLLQKTNN